MRICAIDVGTNTVQSVVADITVGGSMTVLADEERFARLGQGVDASRRLAADAMDRVVHRLEQAQETAVRLGAERIVIGATSASRDASNVADLQTRVRDELGLDYKVIAGAEEAALSFDGALAMLPDVPRALVADIGGGSTELALGWRMKATVSASLDIGSVRLTDRFVSEHPAAGPQARAARNSIVAALNGAPESLRAPTDQPRAPLVATGSVARLVGRMSGQPDGLGQIPRSAVAHLSAKLLASTPAEALALDPRAMAGREDVAAMAVLILDTVLDWFHLDSFIATSGGLRHGLALRAALHREANVR